jgi:hypothetical protein
LSPVSNTQYNISNGIPISMYADMDPLSALVTFFIHNTSTVAAELYLGTSEFSFYGSNYSTLAYFPSSCSPAYAPVFPLGCFSRAQGLAFGVYDVSVNYTNEFGAIGTSPMIYNVSFISETPLITVTESYYSCDCEVCEPCSDSFAGLEWYYWLIILVVGTAFLYSVILYFLWVCYFKSNGFNRLK